MATRPSTISIKDVSKAVEQAVKVASEKHKVHLSTDFRLGPGTIMGRQLQEADIALKQAEQIASEITQHVTSGALAAPAVLKETGVQPAVLIRGGIIICGFIPGPVWELRE